MNIQSNIIYQSLEEKYVESALECLMIAKKHPLTLYHEFNYSDDVIRKGNLEDMKDPSIRKISVIAVDLSKKDYVCGIFPGQDLCEYYKALKQPSAYEPSNVLKKLTLQALEPIIALNYQPGEFLVGKGLGVRPEYENQNIGSKLTIEFVKNSARLGYQVGGSIFYNQASAHIAIKNGGFVVSILNLSSLPLIPDEYRKRLKNSQLYTILLAINPKYDKNKLPRQIQIPSL